MPMDTPGHYYKLFFHDETVALAAGHRPCGHCRPNALKDFIVAWQRAHDKANCNWVGIKEMDLEIHEARSRERSFRSRAVLADLPSGTFVWGEKSDPRPLLYLYGRLHPWEHGGFDEPLELPADAEVKVLTPSPIVATLRAGYTPAVDPDLQCAYPDRLRNL